MCMLHFLICSLTHPLTEFSLTHRSWRHFFPFILSFSSCQSCSIFFSMSPSATSLCSSPQLAPSSSLRSNARSSSLFLLSCFRVPLPFSSPHASALTHSLSRSQIVSPSRSASQARLSQPLTFTPFLYHGYCPTPHQTIHLSLVLLFLPHPSLHWCLSHRIIFIPHRFSLSTHAHVNTVCFAQFSVSSPPESYLTRQRSMGG